MTITPKEKLEALKRSQALQTKALNNARELGGYTVQDGRSIKRGLLLRSTLLHGAAEEDLRILREAYDLRLVLDMRDQSEIDREPDPEIPGVKWVYDPIIDFAALWDEGSRAQGHRPEFDMSTPEGQVKAIAYYLTSGADAGKMYARYLASSFGQAGFRLFFREILANEQGAVLWHCYTGKDRTGIGAGLLLEALGADWETVLADYELSALFFAERIASAESLARAAGYDEELVAKIAGLMAGIHADFLTAAWDYMRAAWGSPLGYLQNALGLTEPDLETLRARYLEA